MEFTTITSAIATVGFPAVAYLITVWMLVKFNDRHRDAESAMATAINNNTIALTKLYEAMARKDDINE